MNGAGGEAIAAGLVAGERLGVDKQGAYATAAGMNGGGCARGPGPNDEQFNASVLTLLYAVVIGLVNGGGGVSHDHYCCKP